MERKIVFFDIDGTLLNDEKEIPESTKKAVHLLQEKGIYTVIATGRGPQMFEWIREELNIHSYVSINGQYVVFDGEVIYANPMDPEMLADITKLAAGQGHAVAYCSHEQVKVSEENHPFIQESFRNFLKLDHPPQDREYFKHTPIYQGHLFCQAHDEQIYAERYPDYCFIRWHEYASDFLPRGCSKAAGIHKLLEAADIKQENSYAFGDAANDVEMLALVGTGVAMGNAVPEAKAAADVITTSSSEDGILHGLVKVGLLENK
ncbi:Cof-type HAD-IIB family hydrolase [Paenactinomyces guangxiensis]|uniref:Cof-type HAD-IIB family hydrolase n=1 Tax=Paenactinomyces guangxiensis TaxID=1490290 RepID=A0A7W1WUU1_9BACL|nr:Cof-type HAD-IIB family hydrolase [Paenactinomyces guangxiensis]MBA4496362.1 Cof-type HAD-IIB family hydrolase [Paenactinomyces guangxiensis]MBH8593605.1 Cof-type HAD-IIB family hydrolase [Paenactinomyces guangxiensis]